MAIDTTDAVMADSEAPSETVLIEDVQDSTNDSKNAQSKNARRKQKKMEEQERQEKKAEEELMQEYHNKLRQELSKEQAAKNKKERAYREIMDAKLPENEQKIFDQLRANGMKEEHVQKMEFDAKKVCLLGQGKKQDVENFVRVPHTKSVLAEMNDPAIGQVYDALHQSLSYPEGMAHFDFSFKTKRFVQALNRAYQCVGICYLPDKDGKPTKTKCSVPYFSLFFSTPESLVHDKWGPRKVFLDLDPRITSDDSSDSANQPHLYREPGETGDEEPQGFPFYVLMDPFTEMVLNNLDVTMFVTPGSMHGDPANKYILAAMITLPHVWHQEMLEEQSKTADQEQKETDQSPEDKMMAKWYCLCDRLVEMVNSVFTQYQQYEEQVTQSVELFESDQSPLEAIFKPVLEKVASDSAAFCKEEVAKLKKALDDMPQQRLFQFHEKDYGHHTIYLEDQLHKLLTCDPESTGKMVVGYDKEEETAFFRERSAKLKKNMDEEAQMTIMERHAKERERALRLNIQMQIVTERHAKKMQSLTKDQRTVCMRLIKGRTQKPDQETDSKDAVDGVHTALAGELCDDQISKNRDFILACQDFSENISDFLNQDDGDTQEDYLEQARKLGENMQALIEMKKTNLMKIDPFIREIANEMLAPVTEEEIEERMLSQEEERELDRIEKGVILHENNIVRGDHAMVRFNQNVKTDGGRLSEEDANEYQNIVRFKNHATEAYREYVKGVPEDTWKKLEARANLRNQEKARVISERKKGWSARFARKMLKFDEDRAWLLKDENLNKFNEECIDLRGLMPLVLEMKFLDVCMRSINSWFKLGTMEDPEQKKRADTLFKQLRLVYAQLILKEAAMPAELRDRIQASAMQKFIDQRKVQAMKTLKKRYKNEDLMVNLNQLLDFVIHRLALDLVNYNENREKMIHSDPANADVENLFNSCLGRQVAIRNQLWFFVDSSVADEMFDLVMQHNDYSEMDALKKRIKKVLKRHWETYKSHILTHYHK